MAHAHEWRVEVTVRGPVDPETGWAVDLAGLDDLLDREVVARFADRDVHEEVEAMAEGRIQPSTEELARWIFRRLEPRMPGAARLLRVRVEEGPELGAVYPAE